jgi:putative protease
MTVTNWYTCNYWGKRGAVRAVAAREISLDEIVEMKKMPKWRLKCKCMA